MSNPAPPIRRDGWTLARRKLFVVAIGMGASVTAAAAAAGMSRESAYRLRARAPAFAAAWRAASAERAAVRRAYFMARYGISPANPTLVTCGDRSLIQRLGTFERRSRSADR